MTVELRPLSRRMLRALYRWEMIPAFPASERRPLPGGSEREEQLRRLSFYRRCGFASLGYRVSLFGVVYTMLGLWNDVPRPDAAMDAHRALYRAQLPPAMFRRFVHIPHETEGTR